MPAVETFASLAYPSNHSNSPKPSGLVSELYGYKYSRFNVNVNSFSSPILLGQVFC